MSLVCVIFATEGIFVTFFLFSGQKNHTDDSQKLISDMIRLALKG